MAANTKNKYPADKSGTKYAEFKNTKRVVTGKTRAEREGKPAGGAGKTASQQAQGAQKA